MVGGGGRRVQARDRLLRPGPAADRDLSVALSFVCVVKVHIRSLSSSPGAIVVFFSCRPHERLMAMEPTYNKKVKRTMEEGWELGFKFNNAGDVWPSSVLFCEGPDARRGLRPPSVRVFT